MTEYDNVVSSFINFLNDVVRRKRKKATNKDFVSRYNAARNLRERVSGEGHKAELKKSVRECYPALEIETLKFFDNMIETLDDGEIKITGEVRTYRRNGEFQELLGACLMDIDISNMLDSGVSSFQKVLKCIRDLGDGEWFVLEFSASDEGGAMSTQPPNDVLNVLLENVTEAVRVIRSDFKLVQISEELNPNKLDSNTIVVNNFDEFNVEGKGRILDYLRQMQNLPMIAVVDNFKRAPISDGKKNIIVFGLTKCRKSGTANDIIKMLDPNAADMVFFEQAALSHTNKVRFYEVGDVRVWDTPGLDDQRGRQELFIKKLHRLVEAVPTINAIYLCVKDAGDLNPNGMGPVREIVRFLPRSVRGRLSMLLTRTSPKIRFEEFNSVRLNARHVSLRGDVSVIQATRGAEDYNLPDKVEEDLQKEPLPFGYITRVLETLDEVRASRPELDTLVAFEVKRSMARLEELIKQKSCLRSTMGVLFSLQKHGIQIKSHNKALSKANVLPRGAKVEFEVFLNMSKRIGLAELIVDKFSGPRSYSMLTRYLTANSLLVFEDVLDRAQGESEFHSKESFDFLLIPVRDIISERLAEDVKKAARYA